MNLPNLQVIFGPPGTGKTTELARLTRQYVEDEGDESVLLCAYTRTAARELAGRELALDDRHVGTLHSHCYHALDCPTIAETKVKDWNTAYPLYTLSRQKSMLPDEMPGGPETGLGDAMLRRVNLYRSRCIPEATWSPQAQLFWRLWSRWKHDNGYLDFTDMIDQARTLVPVAPGRPESILIDEAQDLSLLQWGLLAQWGTHATRVIACGDDDQALYRWAGADFRPLLAAPDRRTLPQSYRVPQKIHAWVQRYTHNLLHHEKKQWKPRPVPGALLYEGGTWRDPHAWVQQLKHWLHDDPWSTYAVVAPCSYMLTTMLAVLREEGIPFANRWRTNRADWNPLSPPGRGVGAVQRLMDYLRPTDRLWTWQELGTWLPWIRVDGVLAPKAKAQVILRAEDLRRCTLPEVEALFQPGALAGALQGSLAWLEDHLLQSHAKTMAYPVRVLQRHGQDALHEAPRLTIGTAHSLKGAEADTVVFFADLSRGQQTALCLGGDEADDVRRMLYVACTRAKEALILVGHDHE
jgi:superfamily I DNA/RNA helicase